jgi:RNA polymerase sigma factor (sigma-70 family)
MTPSDTSLVLACREGDSEAWSTLVQRYQRLIYTVPRRAGLSEDLAADVFQRVFLKLVEQINKIEQPDRISAWLVTTARRESLAILRRERSRSNQISSESEEEDPLATVSAASPLPDELLEQLEDQQLVRQALAQLDERCRTLLELLFYSDKPLSYAQIATALQVPDGSVGPTRARCLQRLRKMLEAAGFTPVSK